MSYVYTNTVDNNLFWVVHPNSIYGQQITTLSSSNNKNMKESTQTRFTVKFHRTSVEEFSYDVLAESLEDAKKMIETGDVRNSSKTISVETKIVE